MHWPVVHVLALHQMTHGPVALVHSQGAQHGDVHARHLPSARELHRTTSRLGIGHTLEVRLDVDRCAPLVPGQPHGCVSAGRRDAPCVTEQPVVLQPPGLDVGRARNRPL